MIFIYTVLLKVSSLISGHEEPFETHTIIETFEKWLRRGSKIFSAKKTTSHNHDRLHTVDVISGKAENI